MRYRHNRRYRVLKRFWHRQSYELADENINEVSARLLYRRLPRPFSRMWLPAIGRTPRCGGFKTQRPKVAGILRGRRWLWLRIEQLHLGRKVKY